MNMNRLSSQSAIAVAAALSVCVPSGLCGDVGCDNLVVSNTIDQVNAGNIGTNSVAFGEDSKASGRHSAVGGGLDNEATAQFATVAGGNYSWADGEFGTVGGGEFNWANGSLSTVCGGYYNEAFGARSVIAGGSMNDSYSYLGVIGGGQVNVISNSLATIGGGGNNRALGVYSTVGGGLHNEALGLSATVPGGYYNRAGASGSLAAGTQAKADNVGAFVWADYTSADFTSTASNQFLIRASGGVGIGTNAPQEALHVAGAGRFEQGITYVPPLGNLSMGSFTNMPAM